MSPALSRGQDKVVQSGGGEEQEELAAFEVVILLYRGYGWLVATRQGCRGCLVYTLMAGVRLEDV